MDNPDRGEALTLADITNKGGTTVLDDIRITLTSPDLLPVRAHEGDAGAETKPALVWKVEHHPTKPRITHVDFYGVDLTKEIQVRVPVEVVGKSKGQVKGGQLEIHRESIEVLCLPLVIPDKIVLDITNVDINESILIADVVLPEGVKAVYDNNYAVIGVLAAAAEAAGEGA